MKHLRQYIRQILLNEGVEFRTLDSPLKYNRYGDIKRIAYCDSSVINPPEGRDPYFKEWERWRKRSSTGRKLKKPKLEEIVPGVSDVCIIGFLDYHKSYTYQDSGNASWYIDYMKTRADFKEQKIARKLIEYFYETVPKPGDEVDFGKMMHPAIGHLKDSMVEKYPNIKTRGGAYY